MILQCRLQICKYIIRRSCGTLEITFFCAQVSLSCWPGLLISFLRTRNNVVALLLHFQFYQKSHGDALRGRIPPPHWHQPTKTRDSLPLPGDQEPYCGMNKKEPWPTSLNTRTGGRFWCTKAYFAINLLIFNVS